MWGKLCRPLRPPLIIIVVIPFLVALSPASAPAEGTKKASDHLALLKGQ